MASSKSSVTAHSNHAHASCRGYSCCQSSPSRLLYFFFVCPRHSCSCASGVGADASAAAAAHLPAPLAAKATTGMTVGRQRQRLRPSPRYDLLTPPPLPQRRAWRSAAVVAAPCYSETPACGVPAGRSPLRRGPPQPTPATLPGELLHHDPPTHPLLHLILLLIN